MKKIVKIIKNNLFGIIIGVIACSSFAVVAATVASSSISYDNTNSESSYDTVQGALDDLYNGLYDLAEASGAGLRLLAHRPKGLSTELIAGLYRYQGENIDNYICFGTTDKNTCTGNQNQYLYRIMGIDSDGRMKLIKWASIGNKAWNSSNGVEWLDSDLYKGLNGLLTENNYFLGTSLVPEGWDSRIANTDWHYITNNNINRTAAEMADLELETGVTEESKKKVNAKIGLMYLHDYYYGLAGGNNCGSSSNGGTCKTSWIHLSHNSANGGSGYEWTISRYSTNNAWGVRSDGYASHDNMTYANSVRPVFYLTSTQAIKSGDGKIGNPYILT